MTVMNLDKLDVWVRAKDFAVVVYKEVVPHLPADEKWNLTSQLKRAAQSISANIAEGHGRFHYLDNVRFCYIARGSLTEIQSHMAFANELGYLPDEIYKYIAYLKRSKQGEKEVPSAYTIREEPEPYIFDDPTEEPPSH